jgi:hypothetical protein
MTGRLQMQMLRSPVGLAVNPGQNVCIDRQNDFLGHVTRSSSWSRLDASLPPEREPQTILTHPGDN